METIATGAADGMLLDSWRWLSFITFLPLVGAALTLLLPERTTMNVLQIRRFSLGVTIITFLASLALLSEFDFNNAGAFQIVEESAWLGGFTYKLGVDGISLPLVILTTALIPLVILASWKIEKRVKEYMIAFLVLETFMIGAFVALDVILFYLFFEGGLIPMFIIIGVWGGANRIYAAFKFFLYTFLGSVLMLIAMIWMINAAGTADITKLLDYPFSAEPYDLLGLIHLPAGVQTLLFLGFFASFAVKLPMWPVHTWLPDAHVQAPTAGSMVLAAILLKLGGYGLMRFSLPMFPEASAYFADFVIVLSIIAIVYTSLVALMQEDVKKLIAYSSVAHMGYVTLGLFSANQQGIDGAVFQMISHGIVSAGLFMLVGIIYDRAHTRMISDFGGLAERMPVYAAVMLLFTMANVGLPGTSGFVGEILALVGAFKASTWAAFWAATGVFLSAAYMLWMYWRVVLGEMVNDTLRHMTDQSPRETAILVPLAVMVLVLGVYPSLLSDIYIGATTRLVAQIEPAFSAALSEPGVSEARMATAEHSIYSEH